MPPRHLSLQQVSLGPHHQHTHGHAYPLSSMIQHFLPSRVKLPFVILQQPLLSQGDCFLGCTEHFRGPLEVLCGFLCFQLSLWREKVL